MGSKFPSKWVIWIVIIVALGAIFFALFMRSPGVPTGSLDDLVALNTVALRGAFLKNSEKEKLLSLYLEEVESFKKSFA